MQQLAENIAFLGFVLPDSAEAFS